jgi:UDP-N-acetylglucosamine 2-epimerase (non-hydrolysing)
MAGQENVKLIEPLDYRSFVTLMSRASLILSDSGGIQEEAPSLDIPVLILREVTERPEGVAAGATRLVGTEANEIVRNSLELLDDPVAYDKMANADNPFGDGTASIKIADAIERYFGGVAER